MANIAELASELVSPFAAARHADVVNHQLNRAIESRKWRALLLRSLLHASQERATYKGAIGKEGTKMKVTEVMKESAKYSQK